MRVVLVLLLALLPAAVGAGQTLGPKLPPIQHVTVVATTSAPDLPADGQVTLVVDVTPKPGIHVYAAGSSEVAPVTIVMTPLAGVRFGRAKYPTPAPAPALTASDPAPAYYAPFRIEQPMSMVKGARLGKTVTVSGALNYQACDAKTCYPATSLPITWTLDVR
jgi:DsbC/DsbD-like thiol-disulfide interchange protein